MDDNIIVRWTDDNPEGTRHWFLRGIRSDGRFYGEVRQVRDEGGILSRIQGQLSKDDVELLHQLKKKIEGLSGRADVGKTPYQGLLSLGTPTKPCVILRYQVGDESTLPAARLFIDIIDMLRPYVSRLY